MKPTFYALYDTKTKDFGKPNIEYKAHLAALRHVDYVGDIGVAPEHRDGLDVRPDGKFNA